MIKFSILIPSYKANYLSEALNSCLQQTYQNFEVIVVDDASPENLGVIVKPFLSDKRVRYYRNKENCGAKDVVDNWNICLEYCSGDYLICMGDDDRLLPCCLDEYAKLIEKFPGIGLLHGWTELIDENGDFLLMQQPRPLFEGPMSVCWNRWNGRGLQYIGDWCFNVKLLRQDGGFYKLPLAWGSDDISAVRAASHNGVANTQKLCFQYRQNRYTISKSGNFDLKMDSIMQEMKWYKSFLSSYIPKEDIEMKFKQNIINEIDQVYRVKFKQLLISDMSTSPFRIFHWLNKRKLYNLSIPRILYACRAGLEKKFHGK